MSAKTMIRSLPCAIAIFAGLCAAALAANVGEPADVAPQVEKTQYQRWPRAAWSAGANCWLVAWREGNLNGQETDIWCARVSADGKAMDPAGICVTRAKDIQDRPVVASDGKGFLVMWQDFRSGKDWDVYAARVTGDGKALDADGFLVAGGAHNQCLPTLAFSGGSYYAAWQSWVEDGAAPGDNIAPAYGSYEVRGSRISSDGKPLDPDGIKLVEATALQPALSAHEEGGLVLFCAAVRHLKKEIPTRGGFKNSPAFLRLDPKTGRPQGSVNVLPYGDKALQQLQATSDKNEAPSVALVSDGSSLAPVRAVNGGLTLLPFSKDGQLAGDAGKMLVFRRDLANQSIVTVSAVACGGDKVLMTYDFPTVEESLAKTRGRVCMRVWGWFLSPKGEILDGGKSGFPIASKDDMDSIQGSPCAGPAGTFLVVYSETRGVEDAKIAARLVK